MYEKVVVSVQAQEHASKYVKVMQQVQTRVQLQANKAIKFTDRFFGTPKSIGIGR